MGKWETRLAEILAAPPKGGTDKTAKRGLVSVLAVPPEGGAAVFTQADPRQTRRQRDRIARLLRWGWPLAEAEALAGRIAAREADDPRRRCVECSRFKPWRCDAYKAAGLQSADVGRDLAALPQHCPAWTPRGTEP